MTQKYTNIYHAKALQELPKLGFLVLPSGKPVSENSRCMQTETGYVRHRAVFVSYVKTIFDAVAACVTNFFHESRANSIQGDPDRAIVYLGQFLKHNSRLNF
jgi:hypothetical protein